MKKPKILFLDIETSMMLYGIFSLRLDSYGTPAHIIRDWNIITAAYKWQGDKKIHVLSVPKNDVFNDYKLVKKLKVVIESADIVVGHNVVAFDLKKIETRCIKHKLDPMPAVQCVDTLKVARQVFKFTSNKLDYIAKFLGVGGKTDNTRGLWVRILQGDGTALAEMKKYNKNDVKIQEKVYNKLKGYAKSHPNMNVIMESEELVCKNCGSKHIHRNGYRMTQAGKYARYRCTDCGAHFRGKKMLKNFDGR